MLRGQLVCVRCAVHAIGHSGLNVVEDVLEVVHNVPFQDVLYLHDPTFESGRRRKARGAPLFSQEDLEEINPSTELVTFDTLLEDESLSEDVREIMRMKYE